MMGHFLGHNSFVKMILFVFVVLVFVKTPAIATEKLDLLAEITGREELVEWAGYGEEKLSTVVISGKLLCHADSATTHPLPISGASVAVFCGTKGKTKKLWAKAKTDSYGEFLIDVPSHLHAIPNLEKICFVKVIHLPRSTSTTTSSPRSRRAQMKRIQLASISDGVRTYTTQNILLMPHKHT